MCINGSIKGFSSQVINVFIWQQKKVMLISRQVICNMCILTQVNIIYTLLNNIYVYMKDIHAHC